MNPGKPIRRVRVVVVNFNGAAFLDRALDGLLATDCPAVSLDIVVVDNASTDGSVDRFEDRYPSVRLIRSPTNVGFAGGNNLALTSLIDVDAVALVNSDCFVSPGWLTPLVAALEADSDVGAVTPKILFAGEWRVATLESALFSPGPGDSRRLGVQVYNQPSGLMYGDGFSHQEHGYRWTNEATAEVFVPATAPPALRMAAESTKPVAVNGHTFTVSSVPEDIDPSYASRVHVINNAGNELTDTWWGRERGMLEVDRGQYDQACDIDGWCGACVLLRSVYLDAVGLLDRNFFLYFEDTDLSLRGSRRGWRYRYEPTSVVEHGYGLSSGSQSQLSRFCSERNRLVVIARYATKPTAARLWSRAIADATRSIAHRDLPDARLRSRSIVGAVRILLRGANRP